MTKASKTSKAVTVNVNSEIMRLAGKQCASCSASAIAILVACKASWNDEVYIATLRQDFLIGYIAGGASIEYEAAIDYLPVAGAKPGTKGKWQPFPVDAPETFDPKVHRPKEVHNAYRAGLTAWSGVRASAGLPSVKAASTRAPRVTEAAAAAPVTIETFVAPSNLDTASAVKLAHNVADVMRRVLASKNIEGDAGAALRTMYEEMVSYIARADLALAPSAPTVEDSSKVIATLRAQLAAAQRKAA